MILAPDINMDIYIRRQNHEDVSMALTYLLTYCLQSTSTTPRPLLAVPNVTAHLSTASVLTLYYLM